MTAIIQAIAGAFLRELLTALTGYFAARRAEERDKTLGRVEAERDAALAAARAADEMNGVALPGVDDVIKRLRDGKA